MPKLVWRVKLVTELGPGVTSETELARIERGEEVGPADLGLRLEEGKRLREHAKLWGMIRRPLP